MGNINLKKKLCYERSYKLCGQRADKTNLKPQQHEKGDTFVGQQNLERLHSVYRSRRGLTNDVTFQKTLKIGNILVW